MPERVYLNRIPGEQRIHIEFTAAEINDLLVDFVVAPDDYPTTKRLHALLCAAHREFFDTKPTPQQEQHHA